jgi:hypothetical protein
MAVSILVNPQLYSPVYNSIVFTVDSTNKTQCNFRYLCDVYVNGVLIAPLKAYPVGSNGYADFKINRAIQDYLSFNLNNNLYGFSDNDQSICKYVCKFGEEYDSSVDCDAGTTVYSDLTTTGSFYAWNGAMQYKEFHDFDYDDYVVDDSSAKFLTNAPSQLMIGLGQQFAINFLNTITSTVKKGVVKTYDSTGTIINTYTIDNGYYTVGASDIYNRMVSWGVGPDNLNNSTLSSGSQPVITSNVNYYTVYLADNSNNVISETKRFNIDTRYTKYGVNRFWWLNRLGGFDAYSYDLLSSRGVSINRTEYHKLMGSFDSATSPDTWHYNIGDRGRTNISIDAQVKFSYNSNWLTEDEAVWMEELFTSPEVYLIDTLNHNCDNITDWECSGGDPNYVKIFVSDIDLYSVGDSVLMTFSGGGVHTGTINVVGDDYIQLTTLCNDFDETDTTGEVYVLGFDAELDPLIITSTAWEEKLKYKTKNIQYLIDVDKAYKINLQRN